MKNSDENPFYFFSAFALLYEVCSGGSSGNLMLCFSFLRCHWRGFDKAVDDHGRLNTHYTVTSLVRVAA